MSDRDIEAIRQRLEDVRKRAEQEPTLAPATMFDWYTWDVEELLAALDAVTGERDALREKVERLKGTIVWMQRNPTMCSADSAEPEVSRTDIIRADNERLRAALAAVAEGLRIAGVSLEQPPSGDLA